MEVEIEIGADGEKPDGFEDCIRKVALDTARIRLKTVKTFSEVLGWDDRIFSAAMTLSMTLEIIGHAEAMGRHEGEQEGIDFIDFFTDTLKKQIRGETVEF